MPRSVRLPRRNVSAPRRGQGGFFRGVGAGGCRRARASGARAQLRADGAALPRPPFRLPEMHEPAGRGGRASCPPLLAGLRARKLSPRCASTACVVRPFDAADVRVGRARARGRADCRGGRSEPRRRPAPAPGGRRPRGHDVTREPRSTCAAARARAGAAAAGARARRARPPGARRGDAAAARRRLRARPRAPVRAARGPRGVQPAGRARRELGRHNCGRGPRGKASRVRRRRRVAVSGRGRAACTPTPHLFEDVHAAPHPPTCSCPSQAAGRCRRARARRADGLRRGLHRLESPPRRARVHAGDGAEPRRPLPGSSRRRAPG